MRGREDIDGGSAAPAPRRPPVEVTARRATLDIAIQIGAQVANLALGLIVTALIARRLGAVGYGQWATIFSLVTIVGYFADLKLQEVTIREITAAPEREAEWLGAMLSLRAALGVPAALVSAVALLVMARSAAMRTAGAIASLTIATGVLTTTSVVFRLHVRNHVTMLVISFNSIAWAAAVIAITATGGGIVPLTVAFVAMSLLTGTLQSLLAVRSAPIEFHHPRRTWPLLVRAGTGVGLAGLLTLAYAKIDQLIVYGLAPHRADAGFYGGVYRILDSAAFVPTAVMTTLFPMIASAVTVDAQRARRLVQTALEWLAVASLPVLAVSVAAARPLVRFLLGHHFVAAAGILPVLMAAYVAICWGYVAGNMVIVLGLQAQFIRYAVIALALNVGLNLALVPTYGYRAAAWVTLVTELAVQGLTFRAVLGEMGMRIELRRVTRTVAACAVLGAVIWALRAAGAGLAILAPAALLLYPPLMIAGRAIDLGELRQIVAARGG